MPGKQEIKETENSPNRHCTHTAGSTDVKVEYKTFNNGSNITCFKYCHYTIAPKLCTLKTSFISGTAANTLQQGYYY
jgi:hypothetical protein